MNTPTPRTLSASVWCAHWMDRADHPAPDWGIGVFGWKYGGEATLCESCEAKRLADVLPRCEANEPLTPVEMEHAAS